MKYLNFNSLSHSFSYMKNGEPVYLPCLFPSLYFRGSLQAEDTSKSITAEKNFVPRSKGAEKEVMQLLFY